MATDYSLYLVADADYAAGRDLAGLVDAAVEGGVTVVQLRAKNLTGGAFVELGLALAGRLAERGIPLLVNDRLDVALACGAAGVHLGQEDVPVPLARRILGPDATIGVSVNTPEEARRAERQGADYVGAGPAFATTTKETPLAVLGPDGIRIIVASDASAGRGHRRDRGGERGGARRGPGPAASPSSRPSSAPRTRGRRPKI